MAPQGERRAPLSAFVSAELGAQTPHASLTRRPAPDVVVTIRPRGFTYDAGPGGALTLTDPSPTGAARSFAHGTLAPTSYGSQAIVVAKAQAKVETLSTVDHRLGFHTWQWRLDTKLEGRVADSGWVGFFDRRSNRLLPVSIPPVEILDARGDDVTPKGARWGLVTSGGQQYLTLSLDDSRLPLPYTIDPGAYRTNVTASSTAGSGTFTLTTPATVNAKDLLLVHEAGKATTATSTFPTAPTDNSGGNSWAQVSGTNVANTTVDQFVWWKWAVSADASKTVTVTIPSSTLPTVTTAVVDVYKGLDSTASGPQTAGATNVGTGSRKFTTPAITPSGATTQEHMIMMVSGTFATSMAWPATVSATGGTWAVQSSGTNTGSASSQSMATYDSDTTANTAYAATASANAWGAVTNSVTSAFGFSDDVTAPTNSITATNVSGGVYLAAASGATGTLYYKGNAAGSFQLQNAVSDGGSGPAQSTFPTLGGTTTGWSHTAPAAVTTPTGGPYSSGASPNNFSWSNPTSSSPTEAIVSTDNAGNTATTTLTFTNDVTTATGAVSFPANGTHYNSAGWTGSISGTAADGGSGVGTVKVSIQKDGGANACWDGTNAAGHFTAACPNYVTATGTTSWSATLGSAALVDGSSYALTVETIDNVTNTDTAAATASWTYDDSAPTATVSFPANSSHYNSAGWNSTLSGTAADASSSVATVKLSIQKDGGANACWDGTNAAGHFTAACPNYVTATGTTSWSATLGSAALVDGSSYALTVQTIDNATNANTNTSAASSTFVYDNTAPTATVSFPANSSHYNSAGWNSTLSGTAADASSSVATVKLSIQKDGGANACWDGTNAAGHFTAACPNYVTATGTTSWSATLGSAALVDGSSYALTVQTIDNATNANTNTSAASSTFVYDNTAPTLSSLAANAAGTSLTLTYNESLDTGSTPAASDFTLEYQSSLGGSWTSKSITGVSVSGSTVVLTLGTAPNDSENIRLSYTGGTNKIRDLAANNAANFSQQAVTNGTTDTTAPTVTGVSASDANGSYKAGAVLHVRVSFSENVTVTGTPQLLLETGTTDENVNYTSGSGTNVLQFNYTVQAGDTSSDLDAHDSAALTLNGGTIKDAAANNAVRTLVVGASNAGALANAKDLVVDTTVPLVGISTPANASFQKTLTSITGTSSDATSGVTGVTLTLQKHGNANGYWNGTSFTGTSATATVFNTSNTGVAFSTWSANVSSVTFADGQQYDINLTATDAATNTGTTTASFTYDTTAPAVAVNTPANSSFSNSVSAVTGTSSDATAGVTGVTLTLQKHGDANGYWNGSSFTGTSGSATVFNASNTGTAFSTWSANVSSVTFADGQQYDVNTSASDAAANTGNSTSSFTFDTTAPAYSSSATDVAGTHVTLTLSEVVSGLNTGVVPAGSAFAVLVNGASDAVTGVAITDSTHVRLTLTTRAYGGDTVTVAYTQPGSNKLQDNAANLLSSFAAQTVTTTATASLSQSTVVAGPTTIYADASGGTTSSTITITLKNSAGSSLGTSGGTVTMTTNLGSLGSVTDVGNGTYTATLTSTTTGAATISAYLDGSTVSERFSTQPTVTVDSGAATKLVFTTQPVGAAGGAAFATQPVVKVEDVNSNVVISDNSTTVTLSIANNAGGGTLSGCSSNPVTAASGVATFAGCKIDKPASGYTLTTSNNHSLTNPTSSSFDITPSADGSGIASISPGSTLAGTTDNTEVLTYTVGAGGISANGAVTLAVPANWSAPQKTTNNAPGFVQANIAGGGYATPNVTTSGQTITVTTPTALAAGDTILIRYGDTSGSSAGAAAAPPAANAGSATWTVQEKSTSGGTLTAITAGGGSPSVAVNNAADGAGSGSYSLSGPVLAGSTDNTQAATFTATTGGVAANAVVELVVPANWTAPQKSTSNGAGYTTASYNDGANHAIASSNIAISGQTVDVTVPVALGSGSTLTITYGDTSSSSAGAAAAPSAANAGNSVFTLRSKSTSGGTITTLATTPTKTVAVVNSADGSGTASIDPTSATAGTTNNTEVLTYTVAAGGIAAGGAVRLTVPSGWTAPQTGSSSSAGYTQANIAGGGYSTTGVSTSGQTITVSTASALDAGDSILVRYGDTSGSSSGAAAATHAADSGPATWTVQEKSTSGGTLTTLTAGSPTVTVNPSSDGSGTASINPTAATAGSTINTQVLTYTVATGGIATNGAITLAVPAGWTAPQTAAPTAAGYVQASLNGGSYATANVTVSGQTITFTAATGLDAGDTVDIRYGDKSAGGPGAAAATSVGAATWTVQEKSTSGGTLTTLGAGSPSVTIAAAALDHLVFSAAGSQTDGVAFTGTNTLTAKDAYDNTVTSFDASADNVTITTTLSGTVGGIHGANGHVLDQAADFTNGVANLTALGIKYTGTIGTGTFTATSAGGKSGTSGNVTIAVGAANATQSTVTANPTAVPADDSTTATITVTLIDVGGNPVGGKTVSLAQALSGGGTSHSTITPSSGSTGSDGVVTFAVKNGFNETVVYTATDTSESVTVTQAASVLFSAVDPDNSTVGASPASITADGSTTSTITVTLRNAASNPVQGRDVTLSQALVGGGTSHSTISAASGSSDVNGVITFTVKSTTAEAVRYTATTTTGITITQTADVTFTPGAPDHLTFTSSTANVASGATKTLTAEVRDVNGNLETGDNSTVVTFAKTAGSGTVTGLGTATASGGVASLTVTGQTAGAVTITASKSGLTSNSSSFSVTAGPADHLTFTSSSSSVASGGAKALTAEIRDANGNLETSDNSTVVAFAKTAGTGTVTGLGTATTSGGIAGLTVTGQIAGAITITASNAGLTSDTSSFSVTVGPADHLTFTSDTASVASGSTKTLTAEIRDAAGNVETGDNATVVTFAKSAGTGTVTGLGTATASSGVASLTVTGQLVGSLTATASKSGLTSDTSTFSVTVGSGDHLTFTSDSSNVVSGATKTLTAELRDAAGNLETGDNSTVVSFAKTAGTGTVTGLGTATASGGTASLTVTGELVGSVTITASKSGLTSDSSTFTVTVGSADHLSFTSGTSSVASGSTKTLTAEIRDAAGDLETGDNATVVTFAKTAGSGTLTGLGTATASGGIASLTVTGHTVGSVTITASKAGLTSDSSTFSVTVGAADHLTFTSDTSSVASGSTKTLTAEIRDAAGNLETGDNSTVVSFAKTAGSGTLTGLGTATASGGIASLTVTGQQVGSLTVTASKSGLTSDSSTFSVTVGPADRLTFTSDTASVSSGATKTLTAEIRDAAGNLETGDNATVVSFAKTAGAGTVTGLGTATASGGVASLTVTGQLVGLLTVTASKSGLTSDTSTFSVTVGPADHLTFTSDTASVTSGATKTLTAEIRDANGNLETADNATVVSFAKTAGAGTVTGLATATASSGVASLSVTGQLVGSLTVTASKSGLTSDSSTFSVIVGAADRLTFTSDTASVASGATKTLTAEIRDAAGNLETGDNSTVVSFAKTAGVGTVTGLGTATASGGIASLTVTGELVGSVTVTASKPGLTSDTSTFSVTAGAADHLTFTSSNANVASGSTKTLTAEIRDAAGNLETGDNSTVVSFAKTAGAGTVTGLGTATASGGIASLTVTGHTIGSLTVTASKSGLTSDTSTFTITVGPADHLTFTSAGSDLVAGATRNLTVEIRDAAGNLQTADNATVVTFAKTAGTGTVTGLGTATASSGIASLTVTAHTAGAITITASKSGLTSDTSSFNVTSGAIDAGASTVVAASGTTSTDTGSTNTITMTVKDAFGNAIASSPVTLTQGAGHSAIAPSLDAGATGSVTTNASGVATFTVSDGTVEGVVYSASASGTPITQTAGVTYTAGTPTKLAFGQQPTNVGVGQSIVPPVTVRVLDSHNNLVTASSAGIALAINANPGGGTLTGGSSVSASGGIATFAGLSIDQIGNGYTLDATSSGLTTATSSSFNVLVAPGLTLSGFTGSAVLDSGNSHRVFFRSGGSGSFVLTATPAGQSSYSFPTISGWTGVQGTAANLNRITYSYAGNSSGGTGLAVTYNDGSADSGPTLFDVVDDSTKPTGGAISAPATASTASVALTTTNYTDADSGIGTNVLTRSSGQAPSGGVCPASGYSGSTVVTSPDATVASGQCYVYSITGTDKVGNSDSATSSPVLVDTSAPTDPVFVSISGVGTSQYYTGSGTTIYFKPGADSTNQFTLTASSTDAQSGVTYNFPHVNGFTETPGAGPGQERYVASSPTTGDGGSGTVTATNGVGTASSGGFSFTIVVDGSGPTGGAFTSPSADTYSTDGHATVTWNAFTDGGSGMSTLTIRRQLTTLAANACDAPGFADDATFAVTLTTASTSIPPETGLTSGKCFRYVTTATDHLGNVTTKTSNAFLVDTTAPATPTLATLTKSGANVFVSGSTVFFKPGADATNTFTASAATTGDAETGVSSSSWAFAGIPGFSAATPAGSATETYTASTPTALQGGSGTATIQNNAGLTSAADAAFSVVADDTAPTGGSFSGVPQYSGNGGVSFSMSLFGDGAGSGLATQTVQRQSAAPTGSACPAAGWTNDGAPTAPAASFNATGLANGTCYRWLFDATDNVGNAATTVVSGPTLVDTSGPTAPALVIDNATNAYVSGSTVYYDPGTGGSFSVTATSTASASGIGAYTFNESTLASHGFTRSGSGNQAVLTFNVGASDTVGTVTATSNSGVSSAATNFSLVGDPTGPAAPTASCSPASCTSNSSVSIDLAANGDGSGSGVKEIRYTIDGSDPTAASTLYAGPFSVGTSATIKAAVIDNLGHVGAISTQTITVDATPPHPTTTDVSGTSMNIHFDKLLVPSEIPATSVFAVSVTANGSTVADNVTNVAISGATVTLTLATTVTNAQTASVTYTKPGANQLQDSFANYVASFSQTATLDVTAPSVLSAAASGTTFTLQFDEPLNGGSVPAPSAFAVTMTAGGSPSSNPVTGVAVSGSMVTLTLGTAVSGYQSAAVAYTQTATNRLADLSGNETAGFTKTVSLDTTAPHTTAAEVNSSSLIIHFDETLANSVPAGNAFAVSLGGLSVSVTGVSISGSDVSLTLGAAATGGQSVSLAYTQPASNRLQDAAANATPSFTLSPTNMTSGGSGVVPTFTSATPADGTTQPSVAGPVALGANEYVAWSNLGVTYVNLAGDAGAWQPLTGGTAQTLSIPFSATAPGLYTIKGTVSDGVTSTNFVTHFTVWTAGSGELPRPTAKTAVPGASGSLATADQKETVSWPAAVVPTTPGDGLIIQMAPQSPATMPAPAGTTWSAGGAPVDITARTILTNTPVTTFSDPLLITFPSATPTDIPIVSTDNGATWRFVSPCESPGVMPSGAKDCYAFSGGVLTVWTLHLTLFALAGDHQPPTAPQKLGVGISGGQIVMRWEPATDNSGVIESYTIFVDGQAVKVLGGKTYEYYVGPASAGDTHVYRAQATDGSGNAGPLSDAWTGVPDLRGLSQQQARDVLGSRGFSVGTIGNAGSGGGVASQSPAAPAYAIVGSPVDFTLSSAVRTPLAMHVVGTRRLNLATRNYAAVRVQVNLGATIDAALSMNGHNVATWSRTVKAGTWILRYTLPAGLAPGEYKLNVSARTATDRRAATIRIRLKHGQVLLGGRARVLVVGDGSRRDTLSITVPKAKVTVTPDTKVWDTTFWSRNVAVVVVDLDRQGLAFVHNLHTVFPSVRIVAVTKNPAKVVQARRFGASAVILSGPATSQLVSATVSALLGRV